jgi:hypothetical protein
MLAWILRLLLLLATAVTAMFVSRDALTFGIIDILVPVLIICFAIAAAGWTLRSPPRVPF